MNLLAITDMHVGQLFTVCGHSLHLEGETEYDSNNSVRHWGNRPPMVGAMSLEGYPLRVLQINPPFVIAELVPLAGAVKTILDSNLLQFMPITPEYAAALCPVDEKLLASLFASAKQTAEHEEILAEVERQAEFSQREAGCKYPWQKFGAKGAG